MTLDHRELKPPKCPVCKGRCVCGGLVLQLGVGRKRVHCCDRCKHVAKRIRAKSRRSRSVEWYTPPEVFDWFAERWGPFHLDPFASPLSPVWPLVPHHLTREQDALTASWRREAFGVPADDPWRSFDNPPYGRGILGDCVARSGRAVADGEVDLAANLVPLRPSSAWCREAMEAGAELVPYPKRIKFLELTPEGKLVRTSGALFECTALVFRGAPTATKRPGLDVG